MRQLLVFQPAGAEEPAQRRGKSVLVREAPKPWSHHLDPIRATGALLLDLPSAVSAVEARRPGVFWLRPRTPQPKDPWDLLKQLADRRQENVDDLYRHVAVSDAELATPVLGSREQ